MPNFLKNKWEWIVAALWMPTWLGIKELGGKLLENLGYAAFVAWLSSLGVTEANLIHAFNLTFPYMVLAAGFYLINYFFKKAVDARVSEKLARSKQTTNKNSGFSIDWSEQQSPYELEEAENTPKTKLELWEEFLNVVKQSAQRLLINPSDKEYFELYKNFDGGLKIMLGPDHVDYQWFFKISFRGYDTRLKVTRLFSNSMSRIENSELSGLIETILQCVRYLQIKDTPFTDVDFRDFPVNDVNRYVRNLEKIGTNFTMKNDVIRYAITPKGTLYRFENGKAVYQGSWATANKEGYDSGDPRIKVMSLEELNPYL